MPSTSQPKNVVFTELCQNHGRLKYRIIHRTVLSVNHANRYANPYESSHIIHIWKEEELLCHVLQDL